MLRHAGKSTDHRGAYTLNVNPSSAEHQDVLTLTAHSAAIPSAMTVSRVSWELPKSEARMNANALLVVRPSRAEKLSPNP